MTDALDDTPIPEIVVERIRGCFQKNLWHRGCEFAPPTRRATEEYLTYSARSTTKLAEMKAQPNAEVFLETAPMINGNDKDVILNELDRMAINESTIFPEIEKAALYIKSTL